jgi:hypothetical protein
MAGNETFVGKVNEDFAIESLAGGQPAPRGVLLVRADGTAISSGATGSRSSQP